MFRRLTTTQLAVDVALAVVLFILCAAMLFGTSLGYGTGAVSWQLVVLVGMSAATALRRAAPGLALGVAWGIAVVQMLASVAPNPVDVATLLVVYTAAAYGSSLTRWFALASALVAPVTITAYILITQGIGELSMCLEFQYQYCVAYVPDLAGRAVGWFIAFAFAFLLAWTIGQLMRTRIRAQVSREAAIAAEHEIAAEQERTRIARDMHDVVAHSLAVVVAQADGARYAARTDPTVADESLRTIAATARDALADVRVLLAQLRYEQNDGPQPTVGDLDRLVEQLRAAGLDVVRVDQGEPRPVATGLQIAAYRIAQESLTNALRHGDPARQVELVLGWSAHGLEVRVENVMLPVSVRTGAIPLPHTVGHGIAGMTERATLAGGWLRAGVDGSRFVVTAWLPYAPTASHLPIRLEESRP